MKMVQLRNHRYNLPTDRQRFRLSGKHHNFGLVALAFLLGACAASKPPVTSHNEDLRPYRVSVVPEERPRETLPPEETPKVEEVTLDPPENSEQILFDTLLAQKAREVALIKEASGYRILIYSGRNPREADEVIEKYDEFSRFNEEIEPKATRDYEQPNYKVRVGNFFTRIEAFYFLNKIKEEFPNAIVTPATVELDKIRKKYNAPIVEVEEEPEETTDDN